VSSLWAVGMWRRTSVITVPTSWRMAEPPSPAQRCEVAKDCRPFVRDNFVEFTGHQAPDGGSLVTTKALHQLPALTHLVALDVPLRCAHASESFIEPEGLDLDLCLAVRRAPAEAQAELQAASEQRHSGLH
jgi:hypothetical protein